MICITQFVYVHDGMEGIFHEFESRVLPLLERHQGKLLMRIRPTADQFIAGELDPPYEVHLVSFESEEGLQGYGNDPERQRWLIMKDESVINVIIVKGVV